jgi:hypothetical protein
MARIRSIKQDFFLDEELAECDMAARILFEGLWVIADKAGRLSDRPQRIKPQILPYDDVDVDVLLAQLADRNFIIRYEAEGRRYIQIRNFLRHQKPHPKEPESIIPPPDAVEKNDQPWKKIEGREEEDCTETITDTSSRRNGSGNGSGDGNGDLGSLDPGMGSGDSAKAGASAGGLPKGVSVEDFRIWKLGVEMLKATGDTEKNARSFLGQQIQSYGKSRVAHAITEAMAQEAIDPKSYIVKVLQNGPNKPTGYQTTPERRDSSLHRRLAVVTELRSRSGGAVN